MAGIDFTQLLEDVQKDIEDAELEIAELKGIQSFAERKKGNPAESKLRPELLDELLSAVTEDLQAAEEKIPELEGVLKYAKMKAGGPVLKGISKTPPPPSPPTPGTPKPPEPAEAKQKTPPPPKPFQPKDERKDEEADSSPAPSGKNMRTVVFGPDGFPVDD